MQRLVERVLGQYADAFEVFVAGSLAEAAVVQAQSSPDLVVLDLDLPNGRGVVSLRAARRIAHGAPIVVFEGGRTDISKSEREECGVVGWIDKAEEGVPGLVRVLAGRLDPERAAAVVGRA